ncbi:MAG TPA: hypothetical protein VGP22_12720 [Albitalea sp.]|nr:hypothetical protein [Albitalea sp.]
MASISAPTRWSSMSRTIALLCIAAVFGVVVATSFTCGVGLATGTGAWCSLPLYWVGGAMPAMGSAVLFGWPASMLFHRFGLRRWWHFVVGGIVFALPVWIQLAQPFESARWLASGVFDSLNYLGSGAVAGLVFWWLSVGRQPR